MNTSKTKGYAYNFFLSFYIESYCTVNFIPNKEMVGSISNLFIFRFAAVEIMCQYGILLENFEENGEFINNCIFTMMHHIGGDLGKVSILFQPNILKTFSQIWESDFELCDVSIQLSYIKNMDITSFLIRKFIKKESDLLIFHVQAWTLF